MRFTHWATIKGHRLPCVRFGKMLILLLGCSPGYDHISFIMRNRVDRLESR